MENHNNILVVEDSAVRAEMLRRLLETNGYNVTLAEDGREALSLLRAYRPALIISDIIMPRMDGYELISAIKRDESMVDIPVLLLTTLSETDDIVRGLASQADGYLTKPYDPDFLLSKARSTLDAPVERKTMADHQEFRITVDGSLHTISIDPQSFMGLILSVYDNTIHTNQRLMRAERELQSLNRQLEQKVEERTAYLEAEIAKREKVEEHLLESRERLSSIVESAHDPIVGADSKGTIIAWNAAATRTFGYTPDEALGQSVNLIMPERFVEVHERALKRAVAKGSLYFDKHIREVFGLRKDGTEFPLESSVSSWKTSEGIFFTAILRDLTARRQAQKSERETKERMEALFNAATDSMWLLDVDGRVLAANRVAADGLGKTVQELLGKSFLELLPTDLAQKRQGRIEEVLRTGKPMRFEDRRNDRFFNISIYPVFNAAGEVTGTALFKADLTDRRRAEEELRSLGESLVGQNEELRAMAKELERKNEQAQTMTQQLWQAAKLATIGELAASIAHELNNPLATVSLRAEGLLSKTPSDHPNRRSLEIMQQEIERMGNLVANLLQFSRRYGKQISTVNVCDELDKTLELIHGHLRNHGIEVRRECAADVPSIQMDRQQLRQVFLNLITNAGDAMPTGGTLTIRVEVNFSATDHILIQVADTGVGIPPEAFERVVEPFFTTKPEGKGTGLGLPICKRIVEDYGGKLSLASEVGKGTNVSITFPPAQTSNTDYLRDGGGPYNDNGIG
jgi:PAS domain S-box-containing protein